MKEMLARIPLTDPLRVRMWRFDRATVPTDEKASALLQGRYQDDPRVQVARPREVVDELLATVFTVEGHVVTAVVLVGLATLATVVLVFLLSFRLRRGEFRTLALLGAPRRTVAGLFALEVGLTVFLGLAVAGLLTAAVARHADELVRLFVLS